jgi:hypothetical protein
MASESVEGENELDGGRDISHNARTGQKAILCCMRYQLEIYLVRIIIWNSGESS